MEKKITRTCIVCEKGLLSLTTGKVRQSYEEPIEGGSTFRISNHFGSKLEELMQGFGNNLENWFDVEVCICDDCLMKKRTIVHKIVTETVIKAHSHL